MTRESQVDVERKKMRTLMSKHGDLGAFDSEPRYHLDCIVQNAESGNKVDWSRYADADGWELYSSMDGANKAAQELTKQAKKLYNSILMEKMAVED